MLQERNKFPQMRKKFRLRCQNLQSQFANWAIRLMSWPSIRNVSSNIQHEDFSRKRWGGRSSFLSNAERACCRVDWWLRLSNARRDVGAFFQRGLSFAFAVEHFSKFWRFCSTFGFARSEFWGVGRQKRVIHSVFCLLPDSCGPNLEAPVDYWMFCPAFTNARSAFVRTLQIIVKCSAALRVFINIQELLSKRSTIHLNRTA